jgi:carbon dioxide concentrating mechanism protein CcmN
VSTVFNYSVEPEQVVAPGSLLANDRGGSETEAQVAPKPVESVTEVEPVPEVKPEEEAAKSAVDPPKSTPSATQSSIHSAIARNLIANPPTSRINGHLETPSPEPTLDSSTENPPSEGINPPVYGHQHLQRLMSTLFPHRQQFDSGIQDSLVSEDNDQ